MFMKKKYEQPILYLVSLEYNYLLSENSGEIGTGDYEAKQNDLTWNDEVNDLWGDEPEEGK